MALLLCSDRAERPVARSAAPSRSARVAKPASPARPERAEDAEVTVHSHGSLPAPLDGDAAQLRAAVATLDRPDASVKDLQDLGAVLTQLLRERPELGPAVVDALEETRERTVLLQLWRSLRAVAGTQPVHDRLLGIAAHEGDDARREAAVLVLAGLGDARADKTFAALLADDGAGVLARSAAAYALSRDLESLDAPARDAALAQARALAASAATPERLRAESFDLVGAQLQPADRDVARRALEEPSEKVAFAAARALLNSGEDRASVARTLRARAHGDATLLAQLELLEGKTP